MKIAQIAPLIESVPPKLYGGTERIVSYLTEELVGLGHDVTLFASADSRTSARLVPCAMKINGPRSATAEWQVRELRVGRVRDPRSTSPPKAHQAGGRRGKERAAQRSSDWRRGARSAPPTRTTYRWRLRCTSPTRTTY